MNFEYNFVNEILYMGCWEPSLQNVVLFFANGFWNANSKPTGSIDQYRQVLTGYYFYFPPELAGHAAFIFIFYGIPWRIKNKKNFKILRPACYTVKLIYSVTN
jgi:hypothetical protein